MTQPGDIDAADRERRLDEAIAAYLAAEDAGHPPPRDDFLARDPELVEGLRSFFHEYDRLGRLAEPLPHSGRSGRAVRRDCRLRDHPRQLDRRSDPGRHQRRHAGVRIRYFGDYQLARVSARAAWAWCTRPARSASTASSPSS